MNERRRVLIVAIIALYMCTACGCEGKRTGRERPFEAEAWRKDETLYVRGQMSQDLVRSRLVTGKSSREVLDLLGEPNWRNERSFWVYLVAAHGGLLMIVTIGRRPARLAANMPAS